MYSKHTQMDLSGDLSVAKEVRIKNPWTFSCRRPRKYVLSIVLSFEIDCDFIVVKTNFGTAGKKETQKFRDCLENNTCFSHEESNSGLYRYECQCSIPEEKYWCYMPDGDRGYFFNSTSEDEIKYYMDKDTREKLNKILNSF